MAEKSQCHFFRFHTFTRCFGAYRLLLISPIADHTKCERFLRAFRVNLLNIDNDRLSFVMPAHEGCSDASSKPRRDQTTFRAARQFFDSR